MISPLRLRLMTCADLVFADSLRARSGWNQTLEDWERYLKLEPDGCFLAEWNGAPAGTATTTVYGRELAWIGMVLVHPGYRRRGIGRALLQRCIEYLRGRGVRCIKLDATPAGEQVYDELGFKDEWTLTRWERAALDLQPARGDPCIRAWANSDVLSVARLDRELFGVSRARVLTALVGQSRHALVTESKTGSLAGYGLLRSGARALYLGPVAASSDEAGIRLIEALTTRIGGQHIYWDIPDQNTAAVSWARQNGFTVQRPLTRMFLGENFAPGDPQKQFALGGPEIG